MIAVQSKSSWKLYRLGLAISLYGQYGAHLSVLSLIEMVVDNAFESYRCTHTPVK